MMKHLFFLVINLMILTSMIGQSSYLSVINEIRYDLKAVGKTNIIQGDFNGDGIIDYAYSTENNTNSFIRIITRDEDKYKTLSVSGYFDFPITWIEYDKVNNMIYCSFDNKTLYKYDPVTWLGEFVLDAFVIESFKIYKVDGNTFFALNHGVSISIFNENNQSVFYQSISIENLMVGNVDNDSQPEIIINGSSKSYVIDCISYEEEWLINDFGRILTIGDPDNNGISYIYGADKKELTCYDVLTKSIVWQKEYDDSIINLHYYESDILNNDLLMMSYYNGKIITGNVPVSGSQVWSISTLANNVDKFLLSHINQGGQQNLFYFGGEGYFKYPVVKDLNSNKEWIKNQYSGMAYVDLIEKDSSGIKDIIFCSEHTLGNTDDALLEVYSGEHNDLIKSQLLRPEISSVDSYLYDGDLYYIIRYDLSIYIFKNNFDRIYCRGNFNDLTFDKIEVAQITPNTPPVIVGLNKHNGRIGILNFVEGVFTEQWSSPYIVGNAMNMIAGNYDNDESLEVAILYKNQVTIFDLSSNLIENQIPIIMESGHSGIAISDYDTDGVMDLIVGAESNDQSTTYQVINLVTKEKSEFPLNNHASSIHDIRINNIDLSESDEILIISDSLYIKSVQDNSSIYVYPLDKLPNTSFSYDFIIEDVDQDNHNDIFISYFNTIYRFKVKSEYNDVIQPYLVKTSPQNTDKKIASNQAIRFYFSESLELTSLDNNISVVDESGISPNFDVEWEDYNNSILISPLDGWTINKEVHIRLSKDLKDLEGNKIDGNKNLIEDAFDDIEYVFEVGKGADVQRPYFDELTIIDKCVPGQIEIVSGVVYDDLGAFHSDIVYVEYSIDEKLLPKDGISIEAKDKKWDSSKENFEFNFRTNDLSVGEHKLYLRALDNIGNWSELDSMIFIIKYENPANWNLYGKDLFNTSANKASELKIPNNIQYEILDTIGSEGSGVSTKGLTRSIVVDDYLIYCSHSTIYVRSLSTGDLKWSRFFGDSELSAPSSAYGNIYVSGLKNGKLICLSILDGHMKWKHGIGKSTGLAIKDGIIVMIRKGSNDIGAIDAYTGKLIWLTDLGTFSQGGGLPAIYKNKIYSYWSDFGVLDLNDGTLIKRILKDDIPIDGFNEWVSDPVIDTTNNQIILSNWEGIFALDLDTYSLNWKISSDEVFISTPALLNNSIYVSTVNSLLEIEASTGNILWKDENNNGRFNTIVSNDIIAFSNEEKTLVLDKNTKNTIFTYPSGANLTLSENHLILCNYYENKLTVINNVTVEKISDVDETAPLVKNIYSQVELYPSVTTGILNVDIKEPISNEITMIVYNAKMQLITKHNIPSNNYKCDISTYPTGVYFIHFSTPSFNEVKKIILIK